MEKSKYMKGIIIFGVLILPLIYSLVYLGGFWDPYGNLEGVPVALVNEDECEDSCRSDELIDKLLDKGTFDFDVVSKEEGEYGLVNKKYYAVITIPSDFTSSFDKASTKERHGTTITYAPNKKTSYLASQIINSAMTQVETELHAEVTKEVVDNLSSKLEEVPNQTSQISSGLSKLSAGSKELSDGTSTLKMGTSNLNTSYKAFDNGINELTSGINTLNSNYKVLDDGINDLYNSVHTLVPNAKQQLEALQSGVSELKNGSNTLDEAITSGNYKVQMNNFFNNTESVYVALANMCDSGSLTDTNLCTVAKSYTFVNSQTGQSGIESLKSSSNMIIDSENKLNDGINTLSNSLSGVNSLSNGLNALDDGVLKIKNGSSSVYAGINSLKEGASSLSVNSSKINAGVNKLDTSVSALKNGSQDLNAGVNEAKKEIDSKVEETNDSLEDLSGLSSYAADPVKIKEESYGKVDKYGTFFAPYFMSLSLWIGGILILIGLYYDPENRFEVLGRNSKRKGLRLLIYNGLGVVQALILGFVLKTTMGYTVTNSLLYYGSLILISISFFAIISFLFFNFKDFGKFIAIVLLVLQLAASGGTFPVETEPLFYQLVYPFMPMKYSIELLRESLVLIDSNILIKDVIVLTVIFVCFTVLNFIIDYLKKVKD